MPVSTAPSQTMGETLMSLVFLQADDDLDPKFTHSKTECRAERAAAVIPRFVEQLLRQVQPPTVRQAELLYNEYRQFHCSRLPFRSHITRARAHYPEQYYYRYAPLELLLAALQRPERLSRNQAIELLFRLHQQVTRQAAIH